MGLDWSLILTLAQGQAIGVDVVAELLPMVEAGLLSPPDDDEDLADDARWSEAVA